MMEQILSLPQARMSRVQNTQGAGPPPDRKTLRLLLIGHRHVSFRVSILSFTFYTEGTQYLRPNLFIVQVLHCDGVLRRERLGFLLEAA